MKGIEITATPHIRPNETICGTVRVNYSGRFDGIVVNTQIFDSNGLLEYMTCNGKKLDKNVTRLFIPRDSVKNGTAEFTARICFEPQKKHEVKFRASIIEQHKEVESDIVFAEYSA